MPTRRRELNQQLFREMNERIHEVSSTLDGAGPGEADFVCECANTGCTDRVTLALVD
jgi:hypothetical protein